MTGKRVVILEQRGTGKLSKEEQAIKEYLISEQPDVVILEIPLKKITRGFVDEQIFSAELVSGSVEFTRHAAKRMHYSCEWQLYCKPYPLRKYLHRKIRAMQLGVVKESDLPLHIKPVTHTKSFTGFVCRDIDDFRLKHFSKHRYVYAADVVEFVSEYRYYYDGNTAQCGHYNGDPEIKPDQAIVDHIISLCGVGIVDIGVLSTGETAIVECCNAYSVGLYDGCSVEHYYKTLALFWAQLVKNLERHLDVELNLAEIRAKIRMRKSTKAGNL